MPRWLLFLCWLAVVATHSQGVAQNSEAWQFERLYVNDGRELPGLLLTEKNGTYEFAEFVRPPGKPSYAIIRMVPLDKVTLYQPLKGAERDLLTERYINIRHHALIEANRMEDVKFAAVPGDKLVYDGPWFTMHSTADEATTRRSIVRIEQTFCAYRQLLPPRIKQASSFQIYLYGSSREYREAQKQGGWEIAHPAFFATTKNLVMAGTDLAAFSLELERVSAENNRVQKQMKELTTLFEATLAQTAAEMKRNGFTSDDVETEIRGRRAIWNKQNKQLAENFADAEKRNAAKFNEITASMFRRLHHEAFHAYLENYVFPHEQFDVPRWLNEGFAQVFEHAQLDSDTLRIDAPPPELLRQLKEDLKGARPLSLQELITNDQSLLAAHDSRIKASQRHYLYAWGLTYHLAFQRPKLAGQELEAFVAHDAKSDPQERLEKLIKQPLTEFEKQWRADMLGLR